MSPRCCFSLEKAKHSVVKYNPDGRPVMLRPKGKSNDHLVKTFLFGRGEVSEREDVRYKGRAWAM